MPRMAALPGGTFLMGSEDGRRDERPIHEVVLSPFEVGVCPVTNAEYAAFLDATGWQNPRGWGEPAFDEPTAPVCGVSWFDAVRYCEWLSAVRNDVRSDTRYHLPTEAQRQYAAGGGPQGWRYPWGDAEPPLERYYARGLDGPLTGRPMPVGTVPWWPEDPPAQIGPAPGPFGL